MIEGTRRAARHYFTKFETKVLIRATVYDPVIKKNLVENYRIRIGKLEKLKKTTPKNSIKKLTKKMKLPPKSSKSVTNKLRNIAKFYVEKKRLRKLFESAWELADKGKTEKLTQMENKIIAFRMKQILKMIKTKHKSSDPKENLSNISLDLSSCESSEEEVMKDLVSENIPTATYECEANINFSDAISRDFEQPIKLIKNQFFDHEMPTTKDEINKHANLEKNGFLNDLTLELTAKLSQIPEPKRTKFTDFFCLVLKTNEHLKNGESKILLDFKQNFDEMVNKTIHDEQFGTHNTLNNSLKNVTDVDELNNKLNMFNTDKDCQRKSKKQQPIKLQEIFKRESNNKRPRSNKNDAPKGEKKIKKMKEGEEHIRSLRKNRFQ